MLKDEVLDKIKGNVAQFISFAPNGKQRFSRVYGFSDNHEFEDLKSAAQTLLDKSSENSINIRTFLDGDSKSTDFIYGIKDVNEAVSKVKGYLANNFYVILNETVDINDGGVSGVVMNGLVEFSPKDTPRCVEKEGTAQMDATMFKGFCKTVYGIDFHLASFGKRIEFSIHPIKRGNKNEQIIIWESSEVEEVYHSPKLEWSNNYSKFIGDKAYGLLIAHLLNFDVPYTQVIGRNLKPFSFGYKLGDQVWTRTCPVEKMAGKYTTVRGYADIYKIMSEEDPENNQIASVLIQDEVPVDYAGACITNSEGKPVIEGNQGFGDEFMLGQGNGELPQEVLDKVLETYYDLQEELGAVSFEWGYVLGSLFLFQLHTEQTLSVGNTVYPGVVKEYVRYPVSEGLENLREKIIPSLKEDQGIALVGNIGLASHFGDILRKRKIPSILEKV